MGLKLYIQVKAESFWRLIDLRLTKNTNLLIHSHATEHSPSFPPLSPSPAFGLAPLILQGQVPPAEGHSAQLTEAMTTHTPYNF